MKKNTNKGSSLLETLIYAAILIMVIIFTVNSLLAMSKSYTAIRAARSLNNSALTAMDRMTREIRLAGSVDDAGSVLSSSSGRLKLNTFDSLGASTTLEFFTDNGAVAVIEGAGQAAEYLTASSTELILLRFDKITNASSTESVKINLTLRSSSGNIQRTENFYQTAALRGGY